MGIRKEFKIGDILLDPIDDIGVVTITKYKPGDRYEFKYIIKSKYTTGYGSFYYADENMIKIGKGNKHLAVKRLFEGPKK